MARANIKVMVGRNGARIMVDSGDTVKVYSPEEFQRLREKKAVLPNQDGTTAPVEKPNKPKTKLGSKKSKKGKK